MWYLETKLLRPETWPTGSHSARAVWKKNLRGGLWRCGFLETFLKPAWANAADEDFVVWLYTHFIICCLNLEVFSTLGFKLQKLSIKERERKSPSLKRSMAMGRQMGARLRSLMVGGSFLRKWFHSMGLESLLELLKWEVFIVLLLFFWTKKFRRKAAEMVNPWDSWAATGGWASRLRGEASECVALPGAYNGLVGRMVAQQGFKGWRTRGLSFEFKQKGIWCFFL